VSIRSISAPPIVAFQSEVARQYWQGTIKLIIKMHAFEKAFEDPRLLSFSPKDFQKWLKITFPLMNPLLQAKMDALVEKRKYSAKNFATIFNSFGFIENGIINKFPRYEWIDPKTFVESMGFDKTRISIRREEPWQIRKDRFNALYDSQTIKSIATQENVYAAFTYMKEKPSYISWQRLREGCWARTISTIEHLLSLGFSKESLCKVLIQGEALKAATNWRYHLAAGIRVNNEFVYIIDLSLSPDKPILVEEWVSICIPKGHIDPKITIIPFDYDVAKDLTITKIASCAYFLFVFEHHCSME